MEQPAMARDWPRHIEELETRGYTVIPDVFPLSLCARTREHMDALLPQRDPEKSAAHYRSHPIPGSIMGDLCTAPAFLEGAEALWGAPATELRLNEQVLIRTDPEPPGSERPHGTGGYHCDFVFQRQHFFTAPRQTYFQCFAICSAGGVAPDGGCTMVIPNSHLRTMELAAETDGSVEALVDLQQQINADCAKFGIDPATGVEIPAPEGALVVFCPFLLHSGSANYDAQNKSRYVVVQSFNHAEAGKMLQQRLAKTRYLKAFHRNTHAAVAAIDPALRPILRGPNLWGEALQEEMAAFHSSGFFVSPEPLLPPETTALIDLLQKEVEPEWSETEFPPGCNRLACQFLMVLQRGGEELLKIVEEPSILALAAALLEVDDNLDDTGAAGAAERVVLEACGMGDTFDVLECNQIGWHSDGDSEQPSLAFRTALDPQGPGTGNAGLRVLPGSQLRTREDVTAELRENEDATDLDNSMTDQGEGGLAAPHPAEVLVPLDGTQTLIWTPVTWHATERQPAGGGPRRAFGWNYGRRGGGGRKRDAAAARHIFPDWQDWPDARKRLWGLDEEEPGEGAAAGGEAKPRL